MPQYSVEVVSTTRFFFTIEAKTLGEARASVETAVKLVRPYDLIHRAGSQFQHGAMTVEQPVIGSIERID